MSVECVNQLGFHRPFTILVKETLSVRNVHNRPVAFKIKTTAPKQYCVRPNSGRIEPGQEVEVQVLLQAMKEEPPQDTKCRDKFLVQSTIISPENESSSISALWTAVEAKNREDIHEKKIRCVFLPHEGSTSSHAPEPHRENSPVSAFHGAETSLSENQVHYSTPVQASVVQKSELFKTAPALASYSTHNDNNNNNVTSESRGQSSSVEAQLQDANRKIEKLQQELSTAKYAKRGDVKSSAHNEGVPVPMTAMIALIAFMAAYLLF